MGRLRIPVGLAFLCLAAPALAQQAGQGSTHVVKAGETLNGIANRAGFPTKRIIEANDLKHPYSIRIGQKLIIPRTGMVSSTPAPAQRTSTGSPTSSAAPARQSSSLTDRDSYVVAPSDTLSSIAARAKVPRILIAEANGLAPPYNVRVGQKLMLPRTKHHTVKAGDTGFSVALDYGVPWEQIAIANGLEPSARLIAGKVLLIPTLIDPPAPAAGTKAPPAAQAITPPAVKFAWPVSGPVRRGFTSRSAKDHHDGIDITAAQGTAVRAVAAGSVIFAQAEPEQFGKLVVVDHGGGWHSAYGSLDRITVKTGDKVTKGERVGLVGNTSVTRKTELHFELRKDGKPVDPVGELPKRP